MEYLPASGLMLRQYRRQLPLNVASQLTVNFNERSDVMRMNDDDDDNIIRRMPCVLILMRKVGLNAFKHRLRVINRSVGGFCGTSASTYPPLVVLTIGAEPSGQYRQCLCPADVMY